MQDKRVELVCRGRGGGGAKQTLYLSLFKRTKFKFLNTSETKNIISILSIDVIAAGLEFKQCEENQYGVINLRTMAEVGQCLLAR